MTGSADRKAGKTAAVKQPAAKKTAASGKPTAKKPAAKKTTGAKRKTADGTVRLTNEEKKLISSFRKCSAAEKKILISLAGRLQEEGSLDLLLNFLGQTLVK